MGTRHFIFQFARWWMLPYAGNAISFHHARKCSKHLRALLVGNVAGKLHMELPLTSVQLASLVSSKSSEWSIQFHRFHSLCVICIDWAGLGFLLMASQIASWRCRQNAHWFQLRGYQTGIVEITWTYFIWRSDFSSDTDFSFLSPEKFHQIFLETTQSE